MAGDTTLNNANLNAQVWAKDLWVEAQAENFFAKFTGKENPTADKANKVALNSIVHLKEDLTEKPGTVITIPLAMKLTGSGVTGDNDLEGNEEQMVFYDFSMTVDQLRNAVKLKGRLEEKKAAFSMRTAAKNLLKIWLTEAMDKAIFTALSTSPTTNRVLYAGTGNAKTGDLETTDVFTLDLISIAKRKAKMASPKIRPVMVKGKPYYILLVHPYQMKAIRDDDDWQNAQKYAGVRGDENPIFSGMEGIYDGVVIHEHENVYTADDWGTGAVHGARALFLGAQAAGEAIAQRPFWEEDLFDYKNKVGFATGLIWKAAKTQFNSEDYGTIAIDTAIVED